VGWGEMYADSERDEVGEDLCELEGWWCLGFCRHVGILGVETRFGGLGGR
jgi:hypothetical protein